MPRSKFATKAYGPTKPAICEDQQLPPGTLSPGPGRENAAHFRLNVRISPTLSQPIVGTAILVRTSDPNKYEGSCFYNGYRITIVLIAFAPFYWPHVEWYFYKDGITQYGAAMEALNPKSVDPYDTGVLMIPATPTEGFQMVRIVARA